MSYYILEFNSLNCDKHVYIEQLVISDWIRMVSTSGDYYLLTPVTPCGGS